MESEDSWRVDNAGRDLARTALFALGENAASGLVVVLAGHGPTGAAGVHAAQHLLECGVAVKLCCMGPAPDAELDRVRAAFVHAGGLELDPARLSDEKPDLIVDAVGGPPRSTRWVQAASISLVRLEIPPPSRHLRADPDRTSPPLWTMRLALRGNGVSLGSAGELFL